MTIGAGAPEFTVQPVSSGNRHTNIQCPRSDVLSDTRLSSGSS